MAQTTTVTHTGNVKTTRQAIGGVGVAFLVAGVIGFFDPTVFGLFSLTMGHNWVHVITGLLYTYLGFAQVGTNVTAWVARVGGSVYALLGVVGFFAPDILAPLMTLGTNENVFHLLIGIVVAVLGFLLPTRDAMAR